MSFIRGVIVTWCNLELFLTCTSTKIMFKLDWTEAVMNIHCMVDGPLQSIHFSFLYNICRSLYCLSFLISGVMVGVLASSVVDRGFEPRSGQTKDYRIGICCFSTKYAALRRKSKDWLARNQNNVSEWSDMSIRGLLFQWASTIKIQLSMLV
jgi:hypothetical protein